MKDSVVIIGAGQAGASLAHRLAGDNGRYNIHLLGDEQYVPYQRPPLSKGVLSGVTPLDSLWLHSADFYSTQGISLALSSRVEQINPEARVVYTSQGQIAYDSLVLTTGGRARQLDIPGMHLRHVYHVRTLDQSLALKEQITRCTRVVIIGGGFIGLEVAATVRQAGCHVTVLEAQHRLLSRTLPEVVASAVASIHRDRGIDIRTDVGVAAIEGREQVEAVVLGDGSSIDADLVVVGVGMIPHCYLAEQIGLAVDNGVLVDQYCRTSLAGVYAAGDCACTFLPRYGQHIRLESFHNANEQGAYVASVIAGGTTPYNPVPFVWSDQFDFVLQVAGLPQFADSYVTRGSATEGNLLVFALDGDKLIAVIGFGALTAIAKGVLIGRKIIEADKPVDTHRLADETFPIKQLLQ